MEEWKKLEGTRYYVSNLGNVKNEKGVLLHPKKTTNGYVNCAAGYIHRLIAIAFIPNPDDKPCVDHINGNREDNRIENLRWCTYKENQNYDLAKKNHYRMGRKGKKNSEEHIRAIKEYYAKRRESRTLNSL